MDEPLLPPETRVTAHFAYIRWHGHGANPWYNYDYSPSELESWVPKVKETTGKARKTYGFFNNHFSANAIKNSVEILEMLDRATPKQKGVLDKITAHRQKALMQSQGMTLTAYVAPVPASPRSLSSRKPEAEGSSTAWTLSDGMLEVARRNAEAKGDAENLEYPDSMFDVVISNMSFQFLPDKQRALKEMYRVLKPGGGARDTFWGGNHVP